MYEVPLNTENSMEKNLNASNVEGILPHPHPVKSSSEKLLAGN